MSFRLFENVALKGLQCLDAETAHRATIAALKSGLMPPRKGRPDPRLEVKLWDLAFPNPVGMAAGFDKNGEVPDALLDLGFGYTEVGSVTPRPQPGNPKPRVFRLPGDEGVINRYGFNNEGHEALRSRLDGRRSLKGIVGINVGANKDAEDRIADYVAGIYRFADIASYFTVNISSPNTPGLRDMQARSVLADLLTGVISARDESTHKIGRRVPVLLKIAPDVADEDLTDIVEEVLAKNVDGLIVSNTTVSREGLSGSPRDQEAGGLSGRPLFHKSTVMLARARKLSGPDLPIIGVGGIDSAETAFEKIAAGADLLQLYSSLVFKGPALVADILNGLSNILDKQGLGTLRDARDGKVEEWAAKTP
ncbi:MAG: quinone-dependent dihydroorotate dehydrogenase [Roseibium sp.]|uniref:quinone-dependent dihydroorotate dehydrogenase n=1 Tax=Roseibium sp. TaxID=1936156 RepID=UPI001B2B743F|nr:quinone-dependent dihydroorotate dehydrogenase [Roseibium sp.]MBO6890852.1 quinone-dependent dihydroorotate dehydrogenase [Roseibium sp.]MBO6932772.1 quinone-dependent dihydroorotate dehydrogenase [Roseibium sp.]